MKTTKPTTTKINTKTQRVSDAKQWPVDGLAKVIDAAKFFNASKHFVYDLINSGKLEHVRIGDTTIRIPWKALHELVERSTTRATSRAG